MKLKFEARHFKTLGSRSVPSCAPQSLHQFGSDVSYLFLSLGTDYEVHFDIIKHCNEVAKKAPYKFISRQRFVFKD